MADQRKKEDKKAGLPALNLRSAGAYGGASSAAGGSAGGGLLGLGTAGAKVALLLVLTALGGGAYGVSRIFAPAADGGSRFWHVGAARPADVPAVSPKPSAPAASPDASGLGMVSGSLDDRSAAERAADDAAKAAAAQPAAPDAAASANATAAAAAGSLTAQAGGPKASPFAQKFGALSQGSSGGAVIGGGLNGGSGLSGGVGLGFDRQLSAPKNFSASRGKTGSQAALMARSSAGSRGRGMAYKQLMRSSGLSRQAAGASGETSSALAGQAFTGQSAGGSPITGGGAAGNTTGAGATAGGPINQPTSSVVRQPATEAPPTASHKDASPWSAQAKLAGILLLLAGILLLVAQVLAHYKLYPYAKIAAGVAAGLGAAAAAIGLQMMMQGQTMFGAIFTAGGALISILSVKALIDGSLDDPADKAVAAQTNAGTQGAQTGLQQGAGHVSQLTLSPGSSATLQTTGGPVTVTAGGVPAPVTAPPPASAANTLGSVTKI